MLTSWSPWVLNSDTPKELTCPIQPRVLGTSTGLKLEPQPYKSSNLNGFATRGHLRASPTLLGSQHHRLLSTCNVFRSSTRDNSKLWPNALAFHRFVTFHVCPFFPVRYSIWVSVLRVGGTSSIIIRFRFHGRLLLKAWPVPWSGTWFIIAPSKP